MSNIIAYKPIKHILFVTALLFSAVSAYTGDRLPAAITAFTGGATYCLGDTPSEDLSVTFSTCKFGSGANNPYPITVTWYSNSTNSTSGGTPVLTTDSNTAFVTFTYTPSTLSSGILYYYVEITWAGGGACGGSSPLSSSTFTPSTQAVTVNEPPAQPGPVSGPTSVAPSTSGLAYSISSVSDATSYTWTVPSGWTINSGQGTISMSTTSGTTGGDITVTADNTCGSSAAQTLAVSIASSPPTITLGANPSVVEGSTLADLTYSATTNSPDQYSIDYDATAEGEGFTDVTLAALTASPIVLVVPGAAATATYNGILTVRNSGTGEVSGNYPITVTITSAASPPTITLGSNPSVVEGSTSADLTYSATTNSPDQYSIDYNPIAEGEGFVDVTNALLPVSPIVMTVPGAAAIATYNGILTVRNSGTGEVSGNYPITVTITSAASPPTITLGANPTVCQGTTTANLPYSATSENPDQYSVNYDATAEGEGFSDVVNSSLPGSPINLVVPGGASSGTFNGILTVRNSGTGLSSENYDITVTVIATPATPLAILGSTTVPELTSGLAYSIVEIPDATNYTWIVPTGWSITGGQGSSTILVTSGATGQDGNITVTASNSCGTSAAQTLSVTTYTPADHSVYGCAACHITHEALGGSLTNTLGNSNLCMSCHVTSGAATNKPFENADKAIPGTSGNSHAWDVPSVNASYETVLTSDPEMALRVDSENNDNITCSTCHNQHNSNTNPYYTRISNANDFMCKDCHSPRNVGRYADDNTNHKGSHPVGLAYSGTGDLEPSPTGSAILVGGNIECSSCHQTHFAFTSDGMLLRQTNDDALCTSCHTLGTHNGMSCSDCHQTHNTDKSNIYMIRNTIATPNSGSKTVMFTALTGTNSFADGDATYDGICEVCHTSTSHFMNDGTATDQNHSSVGGAEGTNCSGCHPHNSNFSPAGGSCDDCHNVQAPTFGSSVHVKHKDTYGYSCSTCHYQYGSGGALEGTHPSGSINIAFDPNGMATRNGQDAITPVMNGDKTCDNMYCHSDGRSAYRGTDGTYTWSGTTGSQTAVYSTTPAWGTGTISTCMPCHSGTGNMIDPYTITTPGLVDPLPPSTGSHQRGAHVSNSQELSGNGWAKVNCFWCHNAVNGEDGSPILQGTYGTSYHVDGTTYFDPRSVVDGGTTVNNPTGGSFSYSLLGSAAHCGAGKSCW